jgi:hypothetical protein
MSSVGVIFSERKKEVFMKLNLVECREAKKELEELRDFSGLIMDVQWKLTKSIELFQKIVTYLEDGVALEFPEKAKK